MNPNQMTPEQALQILDVATVPVNAGKLGRADYANVQVALNTLAEFVKANQPAETVVLPFPKTDEPARS